MRALRALLLLTLAAGLARAQGVVRLSRPEYDKLKDEADGPALIVAKKRQPPPVIESAVYELRVDGDAALLELNADVVVTAAAVAPSPETKLFLPAAGRLDTLADRGPAPALAAAEPDGRTALWFPATGRYRITARSALLAGGDGRFELPMVPAASVRFRATSESAGTTFEWSTGGGVPEPLAAGTVRLVPASALVQVRASSTARVPEKAEKPVVIAETVDVVRPERERVFVRTLVRLAVSRAELTEVLLALPAESHVVSVEGPGEPAYEARAGGEVRLRPSAPLRGDVTFALLHWRPAPKEGEPLEATAARVAGAATSRAFLLVNATAARQHQPVTNAGFARTDPADLPVIARPFVTGGTRAYRAVASDARLVFAAPLRTLEPPADTLVSEATLLTVFGGGGTRTDARRFTVETRRSTFALPVEPGEEVVSVSVDDVPVKPLTDGASLQVVLPPNAAGSRRGVELITRRKGVEVPRSGELTVPNVALPAAASLASWTLVLPDDRRYLLVAAAGVKKAGWSADAGIERSVLETGAASWLSDDEGTATVAGQVTDRSGESLPGVTVEIRRGSTVIRTGVTASNGMFRFPNIPPGNYQVRTSLSGFNRVERGVRVNAGGGYNLPIAMSVSASQEIVVTGESPMIDTTQSGSQQTFRTEENKTGLDLGKLFGKKKQKPTPAAAVVEPEPFQVDGVNLPVPRDSAATLSEQTSQRSNAGMRSLPFAIDARGKRLTLAGPVVGKTPLSVTVRVKK